MFPEAVDLGPLIVLVGGFDALVETRKGLGSRLPSASSRASFSGGGTK